VSKTTYSFGTNLELPYDAAVQRVKEALKTEGFGVLTEIDVRKTMREKLGIEMELAANLCAVYTSPSNAYGQSCPMALPLNGEMHP
jgi:hypothetical protein